MSTKNSKKAPVKPTRPISDYFTRKPTVSQTASTAPKLASSISVGGQSQNAKNIKASSDKSASVSSVSQASSYGTSKSSITLVVSDASSSPKTRVRTIMDGVEIVSPPKAATAQYLCPPRNAAKSRSRSPDMRGIASPSSRSGRNTASGRQRKSKFDSDSDAEKPGSAVYISRSHVRSDSEANTPIPTPAPLRSTENLTYNHSQDRENTRKKARLSTPDPAVLSIAGDLVPSSQSEELELAPTRPPMRDPRLVQRNVNKWRQNARSPSPPSFFNDVPMDVDSGDVFSSTSNSGVNSALDVTKSECGLSQGQTPPPQPGRPSSLSPLPPSPTALDPETKAARIIAEIKRKAYDESLLSQPDSPIAEFKEDLSDSSDEDNYLLLSPSRGRGKDNSTAMYKISATKQASTSATQPAGRYALRNRDPSPSPTKRESRGSTRRTRIASTRMPVILAGSLGSKKGKGKAFNPLDELLKEKKLADKGGKGSDAFRQAEAAVANKDAMLQEMELEDDWADEDAAKMAVAERERMIMKSSSPMAFEGVFDDITIDEEDRQRLFGKDGGKAIVDIINSDKAKKRMEQESEKTAGVPFWEASDGDLDDQMTIDESKLPTLDITMDHPILSLFKSAIERNDIAQAALLINSGAMTSISVPDHPSVMSYLCELALSPDDTILSISAFQALTHIWGQSLHPVPGISFLCILSTLIRLDAKVSILETMNWTITPSGHADSHAVQKRDSVLYRLIALVASAARSRCLSKEEIPDILMAMILIANDPLSSADLQCEIMVAVDEVCRSLASGADIAATVESTICTRVLKHVSNLEPINKAFIVSLLGAGIGRTRRMARWIANSIISDKGTVCENNYGELPDLFPILVQITRSRVGNTESTKPGKFEQYEKTDFVDMAFYVQILSVAISNVSAYVVEERKTRCRTISAEEDNKSTLSLILSSIDVLHSGISDIRATHLDRSRTKAALKELSLRIYYQRVSANQSARTLQHYYPGKRTSSA
ncbi:hypothetical protein Hypma_007853 [Hypsizygus marmoreus]|uniref:Uncharacterized protein n=1 Tax=Hypsizygus marmoreus TaxID=39966 RepID=A0A369JRT3_HYPMA|nr:hypothetical protein Hypma_007853 [Hypsizygus marmoreus]